MENALGIILICILLILAIISTRIAKKKGRSSLAWFFITLLLAPGFLILLEDCQLIIIKFIRK